MPCPSVIPTNYILRLLLVQKHFPAHQLISIEQIARFLFIDIKLNQVIESKASSFLSINLFKQTQELSLVFIQDFLYFRKLKTVE